MTTSSLSMNVYTEHDHKGGAFGKTLVHSEDVALGRDGDIKHWLEFISI